MTYPATLETYSDLEAAVGDYLARTDLSTVMPVFVSLFEAEANRVLRTRQMEAATLLYPAPSLTFTVTGTAASTTTSGAIQLSFTSTSTSTTTIQNTLATGTQVFVNDVGGTVEANNTWIVTLISSAKVDLQSSVFNNTYTSGGTFVNESGFATIPSDFLTWRRVTYTGTPHRELEYVTPSILGIYHPVVNNTNFLLSNDIPSMFTIQDNKIYFRPIDTTAVEFDYYQKIPALSSVSSSTNNWLMAKYPDLYLSGTITEAKGYIQDWDEAGIWKSRRDDQFDRIKLLDQKYRAPSYIRPDMRGRIP